jgi:hypothetical protein
LFSIRKRRSKLQQETEHKTALLSALGEEEADVSHTVTQV